MVEGPHHEEAAPGGGGRRPRSGGYKGSPHGGVPLPFYPKISFLGHFLAQARESRGRPTASQGIKG